MDSVSFGNYGKIEFNYIEAKRQVERLNIVSSEVKTTMTDLISAVNELGTLIGYETELLSRSIIFDIFSKDTNYIINCLNAQVRDYKALSEKEGADIEELEKIVDYAVTNNTDYYQTKMQTTLFGRVVYADDNYYNSPQIDNMDLYNEDGSINKEGINNLNDYLKNMNNYVSGQFMTAADGNNLGYNGNEWWITTRASQYLGYNYENNDNSGFEIGSVARPNSIICYNGFSAYVEAVDMVNGKIYVSSASNSNWNGITELDINGNWGSNIAKGYIYLDSPLS